MPNWKDLLKTFAIGFVGTIVVGLALLIFYAAVTFFFPVVILISTIIVIWGVGWFIREFMD